MRRAGITQKDIDNARKSQEMNIIEDCKKFRHIHNHIFQWNRRWYPPTQIRAGNKMSDGYEIKERTVKIWIMLIMKGQLFFILPQHTDILSWLDIYYHKERSKLTSEKLIDQCPNWCSAAWWQNYYGSMPDHTASRWSDRDRYHCLHRPLDVQRTDSSENCLRLFWPIKGVSVNIQDRDGWTPLHAATCWMQPEVL